MPRPALPAKGRARRRALDGRNPGGRGHASERRVAAGSDLGRGAYAGAERHHPGAAVMTAPDVDICDVLDRASVIEFLGNGRGARLCARAAAELRQTRRERDEADLSAGVLENAIDVLMKRRDDELYKAHANGRAGPRESGCAMKTVIRTSLLLAIFCACYVIYDLHYSGDFNANRHSRYDTHCAGCLRLGTVGDDQPR